MKKDVGGTYQLILCRICSAPLHLPIIFPLHVGQLLTPGLQVPQTKCPCWHWNTWDCPVNLSKQTGHSGILLVMWFSEPPGLFLSDRLSDWMMESSIAFLYSSSSTSSLRLLACVSAPESAWGPASCLEISNNNISCSSSLISSKPSSKELLVLVVVLVVVILSARLVDQQHRHLSPDTDIQTCLLSLILSLLLTLIPR